LADFTDQVLRGQVTGIESTADDDLRGLEETILRLNQTLPNASPDLATVKQMQVRLKARIRKEQPARNIPSWKIWFTRPYPRAGVSLAAILLVLALIIIPLLEPSFSSTTATAQDPSINLAVALLLAGMLVVVFWITRRK